MLVRSGLGTILALLGGLLISIDIPILRLAAGDPWMVMFARGFGLSLVLGIILISARGWTDTPVNPFDDRKWVEIAILHSISSVLFTIAVFNTSAANLVFILAFNPMLAAVFAWILIGERPGFVTWLAILLTLVGISIIVSEGIQSGTLFGDIISLATAAVLALSITRTRQSGKDMSLTGALGGMIVAFFAVPFVILFAEVPQAPFWLVLNVFVIVPAAGFTLSLAPRFIPAPQVAMFFMLETVLAPIWIWLIFAEIPSDKTLIGGSIVLMAIAGHSFWQLWSSRKPAIRSI